MVKTSTAPRDADPQPGGLETATASRDADVDLEPRPSTPAPHDDGSQSSQSEDPRSGSSSRPHQIGRYLVISVLGRGGMGIVYEAFDPELDRRVAVKRLHPTRARGPSRLRLLREAQAMARLSHPNVVQVYDVGVDRGQVFVAMELVRGRTISQWLRDEERAWPEIVARFVQAGEGLAAAHDANLVHRDFKPHNVLIGEDGRVRVADFGLASAESTDPAPTEPSSSGPATASYLATSLTMTGAVLGTPRYMAPEQHSGLDAGPAADQFALCVALHEALFGAHPFAGETLLELATNVIEGNYTPPPHRAGIPRWLVDAIRRGLSPEPADRHPSVRDLVLVLEREPRRRRRRTLIGALGLGLGVLGTSWWGWSSSPRCVGGETSIETVWSSSQRDQLTSAVADTLDPTSVQQVVQSLDDYADAWARSHRDVCLEHSDGAMSTPVFDVAMGCLHRGRAAMSGVIEAASTGESQTATRALAAASGLPSVAACQDRERLSLEFDALTDPVQAEHAARLRESVARTEAMHEAGAIALAEQQMIALADPIESLAHPPLTAEFHLTSARLSMDRVDWLPAKRDLSTALVHALTSGADQLAAEATARALFVDLMLEGPEARDPRDESVARALVDRLGSPPALSALLDNNIGVTLALAGDLEGAVRLFERATANADTADDIDPVDRGNYVRNLAVHTADPIAREAHFDRAEAIAQQMLGPDHPWTLELELIRAEHTVDPDQALARSTSACQSTREHPGTPWSRCIRCHVRLAELHDDAGAEDDARRALEQGIECLDTVSPEENPEYVQTERNRLLGHAATLRRDPVEALVHLDRARDALTPHAELPWIAMKLATVNHLRARNLGTLDRGDEAMEPLRAAITTYDEQLERSYSRVQYDRREHARRLLAELEQTQRLRSIPSESSQR